MSLPLLVVIVVVGIGAIVIAVHLTGGSRLARLDDEASARAYFLVDYPDASAARVWITVDGTAAVVELAKGKIGLVNALGSKFLTRMIDVGDLFGAPRASGRRLVLRLKDFTWSGVVLEFADAADAAAVERLFARQRSSGLWKEH